MDRLFMSFISTGLILAHEIGHVLRAQHRNAYTNVWEEENAVNQFSVAYWRVKGQTNRLFQLENMIRQVLANLPDPVPADQDRVVYLLNHFQEISSDPVLTAIISGVWFAPLWNAR